MQTTVRVVRVFACCTALALPFASAAQDFEVHGQTTYVRQYKPAFDAAYSGPNSLSAERAYGYSLTATLFLAARFGDGWEAYFNPELVRGRLLSDLKGLGGFNDGESQRAAGPEWHGYRARAFVRKTWNLGGGMEEQQSEANQVHTRYAAERFVVTGGNISVLDVFDAVDYSRDPRTQFLNWASLTYGAWDYPADSRGYTWGLAGEYITPRWSVRAGRFLVPVESNGLQLDHRFMDHYGDVVELERPFEMGGRKFIARGIVFHNKVDAGAYRDALNAGTPPDVTAVRHTQGKIGYGAGLQAEVTADISAYVRAGWSDGKTEEFMFTEIDRSLAGGVLVKGGRWGRGEDTVGVAAYINGLSRDHRDYLAAGGQGFFLGDGQLTYGTERILEAFYSVRVVRGTWVSADYQYIANPGYNKDRGPASVYGLRLHAEF